MTTESSIEHKKNRTKKRLMTWGFVLLGIVLIVISFRMVLRSVWAKNYVKAKIESSINESFNTELTIESVEGDLYKSITLHRVNLTDMSGESIVEIDSIYTRYQLWSLIKWKLDINEISLFAPKIYLQQEADSTWNISKLVPESEAPSNERNRFLIHVLDLSIQNGSTEIHNNSSRGGIIELLDIELQSSFRLLEYGFETELKGLDFVVRDHRMDEDLNVNLGANYKEGVINLDQLVMFTGSTMIEMAGSFIDDGSSLDLEAIVNPLSWQDVAGFSNESFLIQDVNLRAGLSGSFQNMMVTLGISAVGIESVDLDVEFSIDPVLEIKSLEIQSGMLDLPRLTGNPDMPIFSSLELESKGSLFLNDYANSDFAGNLTLKDPGFQKYQLTDLLIAFELDDNELETSLSAIRGVESIDFQLIAQSVFETPIWQIKLTSDEVNPGQWLSDETLNGIVKFSINANGAGFEPATIPWNIDAQFDEISLYDYTLMNSELGLVLTQDKGDINLSTGLGDADIQLKSTVLNWMGDVPSYVYEIYTQKLDVSDLIVIEDFNTNLNLELIGSGTGIDFSTMKQTASLNVSNSLINGAQLDSLAALISIQDEIMRVKESVLVSEFADADLNWVQNLNDYGDSNNQLDFHLVVKNLSALAPLANLDVLQASGTIEGTIRTPLGVTELTLTTDLSGILLDTISIASYIMKADITGEDTYNFQIDTRFGDILYGEHLVQDLWIRSSGDIDNATNVTGEHRIALEKSDSTSLSTFAKFSYINKVLEVNTSLLQIKAKDKQLDLYRPFKLVYENALVNTDPIYLRGSTGVELTLGFEQTGAQAFNGFLNARDLDLSILQIMAMDEVLFEGNLSGEIDFDFDFDQEIYRSTSEIVISDVNYQGFLVDDIQFGTRLIDHRLITRLFAQKSGEPLITLDLDIPFLPGDPVDFDDSFYNESIVGHLEFHELNLGEQTDFLTRIGFEGTSGLLSAKMDISGTAGSPKFIGELIFGEGRLSGVPIDHFDLGWQYHQDQNNLALTSRIISSGQEVASMSGTAPFNFDWRTFNPIELDEEAEVDLTVKTNSFNLTAVNQFLDQSKFRNLQGILSMDMKINGPIMSPKPTGSLLLSSGNLTVIENNITLRNIESRVHFENDLVQLQNFSFRSEGEFKASGQLKMSGYSPGDVDIKFTARNLKLYDTREIQTFLSMNAALSGNYEAPVLKGSVTLDRGFIYMNNFGERSIEDIQLEDDEVSTFDGLALWKNTTVEMILTTTRNFWVRNRSNPEIQLQLNGELDLVKAKDRDLEVFGRMGVNDGYVMQLGKRFTFDKGDLVFSGEPLNPELEIRTLYALRHPSDISIWYIIGGTAEEPTFSYESDPEMEFQDIISYTVFGRPFHSLMAWEQSITGRSESAVADAAVDILLDRVEQIATDRLGIDLLQIENTRASGNSGTTIRAGKFISDRLFVAILQELGNNPLSMVIIEYELKRDLELILTGSDSYHNGIDIRWKYDY
ncbi:MAG TPA: hypothetical protein DCE78_05565 [Bacteroidetes bacterium]|nr:hypothetical protein [Bacteroidota bacterium]